MDWLIGVSISRPRLLPAGHAVRTLQAVSDWGTDWLVFLSRDHDHFRVGTLSIPCMLCLSDGLNDSVIIGISLFRSRLLPAGHAVCTLHTVMGWAMDWLIGVSISRPQPLPAGCTVYTLHTVSDWWTGVSVSRPWLHWNGHAVYTLHVRFERWTDWFSDGLIDSVMDWMIQWWIDWWPFPLQTVTTSSWARCPTCWTWGPQATRSCRSGRRWLLTPRCATWSCPQSGPRSPASTPAPRRNRTSSPSTLSPSPAKKVCGWERRRRCVCVCVFGEGGGWLGKRASPTPQRRSTSCPSTLNLSPAKKVCGWEREDMCGCVGGGGGGGVRKQSKPNTTKKQNLKSFSSESRRRCVAGWERGRDVCVCVCVEGEWGGYLENWASPTQRWSKT